MTLAIEVDKETLARENFNFIYHIANKFKSQGYPYEEIVSAAQLGFTKALNNYDSSKEVKFATFAATCMTNEILMYIRKEKKKRNRTTSLEAALFSDKDGNELTSLDVLAYEEEEKPDWEGINEAVNQVLSISTERDRQIFLMLISGKNQTTIGEQMGVSQGHVSRIIRNLFNRIKKEYWKEGIVPMAKLKMTADEFVRLKDEQKMPVSRIAKMKGVSDVTIYKFQKDNQEAIEEARKQLESESKVNVSSEIKNAVEEAGDSKYKVLEQAIQQLEQERDVWKQKAEDMRAKAEQHWQEKEDIRKVNADIREEIKRIKDTHHSLHERHRKLSEENETWREVVKMLLDQ